MLVVFPFHFLARFFNSNAFPSSCAGSSAFCCACCLSPLMECCNVWCYFAGWVSCMISGRGQLWIALLLLMKILHLLSQSISIEEFILLVKICETDFDLCRIHVLGIILTNYVRHHDYHCHLDILATSASDSLVLRNT